MGVVVSCGGADYELLPLRLPSLRLGDLVLDLGVEITPGRLHDLRLLGACQQRLDVGADLVDRHHDQTRLPRLEQLGDGLDVLLRDVVVEVADERSGARARHHAHAWSNDGQCRAGPRQVLGRGVVALDLQLAGVVLGEHGDSGVIELAALVRVPDHVETRRPRRRDCCTSRPPA